MDFSRDFLIAQLATLDAKVVEREQELTAARARVADAEAAVANAKAIRAGAEAFIDSLPTESLTGVNSLPTESLTGVTGGFGTGKAGYNSVGVTPAIETILRSHPEGIHLHDVQAIADKQGLGLDGEQIRSAVTYLRKRGNAERLARGVWRYKEKDAAPTVTTDSNGPAEARPFDLAPGPLQSDLATG